MKSSLALLKRREVGEGSTRKRGNSSGGPRRRRGKSYEENDFQKILNVDTLLSPSYASSTEPAPLTPGMELPTMGSSLLRSPSETPPVSPEPPSLCAKTVLRKVPPRPINHASDRASP